MTFTKLINANTPMLGALWSRTEFDWEFHEICAAGRLERLLESGAVALGAWADDVLVGAVLVRIVEMAPGHF